VSIHSTIAVVVSLVVLVYLVVAMLKPENF
jgi:K+-transporting ATPase KdpF subunit